MKRLYIILGLFGVLAFGNLSYASWPADIYLLVEKAELGPDWIKIEGVFMNEVLELRRPWKDNEWGPLRGSVQFKLPTDSSKHSLARAEWKELIGFSGKNKVVAFGGRDSSKIEILLRDRGGTYPVSHGLTAISDNNPQAKKILEFVKSNPRK